MAYRFFILLSQLSPYVKVMMGWFMIEAQTMVLTIALFELRRLLLVAS